MTQLQITYPAARRHDPITSHLAGAEHTANGKRWAHLSRVLDEVRREPGRTYREIATHLPDLEPVEVMRRLADAASAGLAVRGNHRTCRVSGRAAMTWEAA